MFWNNVRALLAEKKILQKDFADSLGYSIATLKNQMARNISPDVDTSVKIAKALDTTVEYLVTGEETNEYKVQLDQLKQTLRKLSE